MIPTEETTNVRIESSQLNLELDHLSFQILSSIIVTSRGLALAQNLVDVRYVQVAISGPFEASISKLTNSRNYLKKCQEGTR